MCPQINVHITASATPCHSILEGQGAYDQGEYAKTNRIIYLQLKNMNTQYRINNQIQHYYA